MQRPKELKPPKGVWRKKQQKVLTPKSIEWIAEQIREHQMQIDPCLRKLGVNPGAFWSLYKKGKAEDCTDPGSLWVFHIISEAEYEARARIMSKLTVKALEEDDMKALTFLAERRWEMTAGHKMREHQQEKLDNLILREKESRILKTEAETQKIRDTYGEQVVDYIAELSAADERYVEVVEQAEDVENEALAEAASRVH